MVELPSHKSDSADTAAADAGSALQSYAPKKVLSSVLRVISDLDWSSKWPGVNLIAFGLTPTAIKSVQGCVPHLSRPDQIWEHVNGFSD